MTQITDISVCKKKLRTGLVMLYGAKGDNGMADQILYLTRNSDLTRKFTGMDYQDLPEPEGVVTGLVDGETVVEGYCLVNRKRMAVDLSTMPGIAVLVGEVVTKNTSVFAPFVDFSDDASEADNDNFGDLAFLVSARQGRCIQTGEVVDVLFENGLDRDFSYVAIINSEEVHLNAYGCTRDGELRLEPVKSSEPLADQYVAQEGAIYLATDAEPAFISAYLEAQAESKPDTDAIRLKAYSIHHKDNGIVGIAIDLA